MIELSFYVLVALLLLSNGFWATVCLKLTNRLMSRNYGELIQATKKPIKIQSVPEDMSDPVAETNAHNMNAIIGSF